MIPTKPTSRALPGDENGDRIGETQGTIGVGGKRVWIYPREITGKFTRKRQWVAWILLVAYLGAPWLHWRGESLLKVDWFGRKLMLASHYFWIQDIPLFLPAFFAFILMVFLITARFGRIWCGWACPQTVFLQFLYAPVEKWIEGRASRRSERDRHPFTFDWLWRKALKHLIFAGMAGWIANTALAYFWGTDNLLWAMRHPSKENWTGLVLVAGFAAFFYWVFAFFREQACILLCPYARFQSVLVDEKTSMVAYDEARGEPRGKGARGNREGFGDCTDCGQCVLVCPTGIDIRQGQQLECIECTRCMDACDRTMAAWKKPAGLIRYASLGELQGKPSRGIPWRQMAYGVLALSMASISGVLLLQRPAIALDLVRKGQSPYTRMGSDSVLNTFTLRVRNNGTQRRILNMELSKSARGRLNWQGRSFAVSGGQTITMPLEITVPVANFQRGKSDQSVIVAGEGLRESIPAKLAGPWGG